MPERVALSHITIGEEGGNRREVMPGERFTIDNEQAAEIDSHDPPIAVDPRVLDAEGRRASAEGDDMVRQVAAPDSSPAARAAGDSNVTREKPAGDKDEL